MSQSRQPTDLGAPGPEFRTWEIYAAWSNFSILGHLRRAACHTIGRYPSVQARTRTSALLRAGRPALLYAAVGDECIVSA
jgi:hypothetical protein